MARYRHRMKRRHFRGDAAFANPEIYEVLEAEAYKYTIRLPTNAVLQERIGWLLKRPVGRPRMKCAAIWLSAGDVRPDPGSRARILAHTAVGDQSARLQPSSRRYHRC